MAVQGVCTSGAKTQDQTGYYVVRPGNGESACLDVSQESCDPHEEFDSVFLVQDFLEEEKPNI